MYFVDSFYHCVRKVTVSTGIITTFAGKGSAGYGGDGGAATSAGLFYPTGIALDSSGTYLPILQLHSAKLNFIRHYSSRQRVHR